ncbi:MAG: hypothetical protein IT210_05625 [Armatimonadetes bacterium]|nr:hypothetical protein [Armatimonadota bacterium]
MPDQIFQSCLRCFMTTQFPGIAIEENGQCSLCNSDTFLQAKKKRVTSNREALEKVAAEVRASRKDDYNCITGGSGGLDSSYVIYVAKAELGLNPLVVHYDHGHFHDHATRNITALCSSLGVDLIYASSAGRYDQKYVRAATRAFKDLGIYWGVCSACHYVIPAMLCWHAQRYGIATTLHSDNVYEAELHVPAAAKFAFMKERLCRIGWPQKARMAGRLALAMYYLLRLKTEFYVPPVRNLLRHRPRKPASLRAVSLSKYLDWDVDYMTKTLVENTPWRPPDYPSLNMRFDCKIEDALVNHTFKEATGQTVHSIIACNLIYDRLRTKEELKPAVDFYESEAADKTREFVGNVE